MIQIGDQFKHSFSYTQEDVDTYARVSGDTNPLHVDADYAAASMFGKRIMHGYLGASVFTKIFGTLLYWDGNVYLKQNLTFLKPMYANQTYQAVITVKEIFAEKNRILFETQIFEEGTENLCTTGEALILNKKQFVW
ncbi:MAG: MaoC family dehydratase [Bacteroidetes bacterium]|nr:MaoC family dehydratase [Bacteroidota bacterium]